MIGEEALEIENKEVVYPTHSRESAVDSFYV